MQREDIIEGGLYKYHYIAPTDDDDEEELLPVENELKALDGMFCKVTDTSDELIDADFDVPENKAHLPYSGEYSVYPEELEPAQVAESLDLSKISGEYPALLVALDSEKDAIVTYESLIEIESASKNKNEETIKLLKKILDDEKEHIALLSALQAKYTEQFVGEDSKPDFDKIIDATKSDE